MGRLFMARLLFRMRHVPDDEAQEVRELLTRHAIDYFETSAGNWGISMPALWVRDEARFREARDLLDTYQAARSARTKAEYQHQRRTGQLRTLADSFSEQPVRFLVHIGLIGLVLYLSLRFFISF